MEEEENGLIGSVFPRDIYMLLLKGGYLSPIDALRLSMTSRRLYPVFTPHERRWMQFDLVPKPFHECGPIKEHEWRQCDTCFAMVKDEHMLQHLMRGKCRKGYREDASHYTAENVCVCTKCMTRVTVKKYERHVKRCKGRTEGWCFECGVRHRHWQTPCPFVFHQCLYCKVRYPRAFFSRPKQCPGCQRLKWDDRCFKCFERCEQCKTYKCELCRTEVDPLVENPHACGAEIVKIAQKMNLSHANIRSYGWHRYIIIDNTSPYRNPRTFCIYVAPSFRQIEPFAGGGDDPCEVFVTSQFHAMSFRAPGDFMWHVDAPPPHCAFCAVTRGTFQWCGRCKKAQYCSKECQRVHWVAHRIECLD